MSQSIVLKAGLKFRSKTFSDEAEIVSMRESSDIILIRLTSSEGHAHIKEWPLQATREHFKQGFYFIPERILNDVTTS
jgi:hypothetical protein